MFPYTLFILMFLVFRCSCCPAHWLYVPWSHALLKFPESEGAWDWALRVDTDPRVPPALGLPLGPWSATAAIRQSY